MTMTTKEAKTLTALYALEDQFWRLVRRRVVVTGLVALLVGAGAGWAAIELVVQRVAETPLRDLQKEIVRAEVQADAAKRASETAKTSSEQVATGLETLNKTLQALGEQAKAIELQFKVQSEEINATSENAALRSQRDFDAVQRRIAALEALVKQIGEENAASRKATADYARQIAALEKKVEAEQKRFAENSAYTVSVFFHPSKRTLAMEVQSRLAALGFRAPVHELPPAIKGISLTFLAQSEAKAQEIIGVLKPVLKELEVKKVPDQKPREYKGGGIIDNPLGLKIEGTASKYLLLGWFDPKGMQLTIGE